LIDTKARQPVFQISNLKTVQSSNAKQGNGYSPKKNNEYPFKTGRVFSTGSNGDPVIISARPRGEPQRSPPMPLSAGMPRSIQVDTYPVPFAVPQVGRSGVQEMLPKRDTAQTLRLVGQEGNAYHGSFVAVASRDGSLQPMQSAPSPKMAPKSKFANSAVLNSVINRYSPKNQRPAEPRYLGINAPSNMTTTFGLKYIQPQLDEKFSREENNQAIQMLQTVHPPQQRTITTIRNIGGPAERHSHL
jgi:hypothetical protein